MPMAARRLFLGRLFRAVARSARAPGLSALQSGYKLGRGSRPDHLQHHEFRKAAGGRAGAAVAHDEAKTLFHEFGHAPAWPC